METNPKQGNGTGPLRRSETRLPQAAHAVIMYFLAVIAGRRQLKLDTLWADEKGREAVSRVLQHLRSFRPGKRCGARILRVAQPLPHCIEVVASLEWGNRLRSCMMELRDQSPTGWQLTYCRMV